MKLTGHAVVVYAMLALFFAAMALYFMLLAPIVI